MNRPPPFRVGENHPTFSVSPSAFVSRPPVGRDGRPLRATLEVGSVVDSYGVRYAVLRQVPPHENQSLWRLCPETTLVVETRHLADKDFTLLHFSEDGKRSRERTYGPAKVTRAFPFERAPGASEVHGKRCGFLKRAALLTAFAEGDVPKRCFQLSELSLLGASFF